MERAATPEQHLWSSILDSVSSSRAIPSKNVIVLGEPSSGKSTLSNALLQRSNQRSRAENQEGGGGSSGDFAIGYDWGNVKDDAEEDILARLSVYTVPSSSPAHLALIPHFLPPKSSLLQTLVMIVLDWTRPSAFLDQMRIWLEWIDQWAQGDGARELEVMREEGRERLQSHIQHYTEPAANSEVLPVPGVNMLSSTLLPLSQGVFTHNRSGVPIIVVCAKADKIDDDAGSGPGLGGNMAGVAKNKGANWEERTDGIMQVMRTVCLKYGAGLFYTSSSQPMSLVQLRSYALHLLFMPPPPATPDQPPAKYLFPFRQRPNLLDRDRIAIPAGWDSWGKIGVVRDGFDCAKWEAAWERDVDQGETAGGACDMYRAFVGMTDADETPGLPPLITTEPEQSFLARQYETLAKDPDPREKFRDPHKPADAGVVGPMGSSVWDMPTVGKAINQMEGEDVATRLTRIGSGANAANAQRSRGDTRGTTPSLAPLAVPGMPNGVPVTSASRAASKMGLAVTTSGSNPTTPGSTTATGGKSQHEVLQDFFQSLLQKGGGA
ncbi:hypothetical protein FRB95_000834, partial [Tulasnella sp. JGI-2019a]